MMIYFDCRYIWYIMWIWINVPSTRPYKGGHEWPWFLTNLHITHLGCWDNFIKFQSGGSLEDRLIHAANCVIMPFFRLYEFNRQHLLPPFRKSELPNIHKYTLTKTATCKTSSPFSDLSRDWRWVSTKLIRSWPNSEFMDSQAWKDAFPKGHGVQKKRS